VVVSAGRSALAEALPARLGRPLVALSAAALSELEFYEPPPPEGAGGAPAA
jgi:hypothetical protein